MAKQTFHLFCAVDGKLHQVLIDKSQMATVLNLISQLNEGSIPVSAKPLDGVEIDVRTLSPEDK